jgi:DNA ligase-1
MITFRYQELSEAGVPRFPSYVGVRIDVRPIPVTKPASRQSAQGAVSKRPGGNVGGTSRG